MVEQTPTLVSIENFSISQLRVILTFKLNSTESEEFMTMIPSVNYFKFFIFSPNLSTTLLTTLFLLYKVPSFILQPRRF